MVPLRQWPAYIFLATLGGWLGLWGQTYWQTRSQLAPSPTPIALKTPPQPQSLQPVRQPSAASPSQTSNFVTDVAEAVGPSVVRIDAVRRAAAKLPGEFENPAMRGFFRNLPLPEERVEQGTGSGFILRGDGRLVTNAHVVSGAEVVSVTLSDGRSYEGQVVGVDPATDIAVIQIDAEGLPAVKLGRSDRVSPGQWAIAIGNPLGLDSTVTIGIISALDRSSSEVGAPDKRLRFIQTDAAINPGNSGGPLLNLDGDVIGMNTAIRTRAQGLGFAIPIETVERIANQLFATGQVQHPYLGIQMVNLTPRVKERLAEQTDIRLASDRDNGVLIVQVAPDSPAQSAGTQPGDVILKVNGKPVKDAAEVQTEVAAGQVGDTVRLEVDRRGEVKTLAIVAAALPVDPEEP